METKVQEHSNLIYREKAIVSYTCWLMEKPIIEEIDDQAYRGKIGSSCICHKEVSDAANYKKNNK